LRYKYIVVGVLTALPDDNHCQVGLVDIIQFFLERGGVLVGEEPFVVRGSCIVVV
jgi:hypothetical protein